MSTEINAYSRRQRQYININKSKIFAFQKSINDFSNENNIICSLENRQKLNRGTIRSSIVDSWSVVDMGITSSNDYVVKTIDSYYDGYKTFSVLNMNKCNNMDNLLRHFHSNQDYPEFYLGKAENMALCRCPQTGEESCNNGNTFLTTEPKKNTIVTARIKIKNIVYEKDFVFVKWETANFYEWRMKSGSILQLHQKYIDGLLDKDKKYLRMHT